MNNDFEYKFVQPDESLTDFVESFWLLQNKSASDKDIVILPDGRLDLFFSQSPTEPFHVILSGLETQADKATLAAGTTMTG